MRRPPRPSSGCPTEQQTKKRPAAVIPMAPWIAAAFSCRILFARPGNCPCFRRRLPLSYSATPCSAGLSGVACMRAGRDRPIMTASLRLSTPGSLPGLWKERCAPANRRSLSAGWLLRSGPFFLTAGIHLRVKAMPSGGRALRRCCGGGQENFQKTDIPH